jgi:hypothetical protein
MKNTALLVAADLLSLGLLFDPDDEGDIFFQNVRLSPHYTALQPRRQHSSTLTLRW